MLTELTVAHPASTDHYLAGTLEQVLEGAKRLLMTYHPIGYGTSISRVHYDARQHHWIAVIHRSNRQDN